MARPDERAAILQPVLDGTEGIALEHFDHIRRVNDVFYDQVKLSDQKAAYIFTFMLALLVTSTESRAVFTWSRYVEGDWTSDIFSGLLALALVFSIVSAILVVLPRRVDNSTSLFWGAWPHHREDFRKAARARDIDYLFEQYMQNADAMASIAREKYRFVGFAFRGLLLTVLAYVALLATR
ncbi:Pycsar system effector family protein [Shinella sp. M31]|uniref:Pycsar system effector family protein n=1 Tax=Shinella sp. M31 TaxID=3368615 RepID=UPI003BA0EF0B